MLSHCSIYISDLTFHLKTWLGLQETVNHQSTQWYFCPLASITKGANFSNRLTRCTPLYAYSSCMGVSLKNDVISAGVCYCFCISSAGRAPLNFCNLACCISVGWQTLPRSPPPKKKCLCFWLWPLLLLRWCCSGGDTCCSREYCSSFLCFSGKCK